MSYKDKEAVVASWHLATRTTPEWEKVHTYADLAGPLAFAKVSGLIDGELSQQAKHFIEEAYALILEVLELPQDLDFINWSDVAEFASEYHKEDNEN